MDCFAVLDLDYLQCCFYYYYQVLVETMEEYCFYPERSKLPQMSTETYHSFLLAMGGIVDTLNKYGSTERAHQIINKIHNMVGLHGMQCCFKAQLFKASLAY